MKMALLGDRKLEAKKTQPSVEKAEEQKNDPRNDRFITLHSSWSSTKHKYEFSFSFVVRKV